MPSIADDGAWGARDPQDCALLEEARRQMMVCAVCKYCNGVCPVFVAAERRLARSAEAWTAAERGEPPFNSGSVGASLSDGDLLYLANLCHDCRTCWYVCQFRPPHAFGIAVPALLARIREMSWRRMAGLPLAYEVGPEVLRPTEGRPTECLDGGRPSSSSGDASGEGGAKGRFRWGALLALVCAVGVPLLTLAGVPWDVLFAVHTGPGAFHAVVPRGLMVWGAMLALLLPLAWVAVALVRFWRATGGGVSVGLAAILRAVPQALYEALTLRHLDGGGVGCHDVDERGSWWRRRWHHFILGGFLLTFAATLSAAVAHHLLGLRAPYPWLSAPVLLGAVGGVSLLAGVTGMTVLRRRAEAAPQALETRSGGTLLLGLLAAVAASGLALLGLRETAAMGLLLALHLGTVLALFVTLPFGRLMHAPFRALAILRAVIERRT